MTSWRNLLFPGDAKDFFTRRPLPPFNPLTHAYSRANARWLAELSRVVYRHDAEEEERPPRPTQTRFLERAGCSGRRFFLSRETDTQAMLVEFASAAPFAVLVFRGTEQNIKDYVTDLTVGLLGASDGKVETHQGFRAALDSVWHEIEPALEQLRCPVFYTGHSLGGALATLAAVRRPPTALYTFGSPRVGDDDFAASLGHLADRIHRVVHGDDIVTTLPPEAMGFRHVGNALTLDAPTRSGWFHWLLARFRPPKPLADHAPVNYVDKT
jgi:pimeloyl-ACP methyl ester carboxylesterase